MCRLFWVVAGMYWVAAGVFWVVAALAINVSFQAHPSIDLKTF